MAVLALVAQFTFVCLVIVFLVATHTSLGHALVLMFDVALQALHFDVFAQQLEFGLVVFEAGGLPIFVCVALGTVLTQLALVRFLVILLMAGVAHAGRLAELLTRFMATLAFDFLAQVAALQHKVGELMVEFLVVEFRCFEVAPFMLGVALFTFLGGVDTTVMAFFLANVFAHIFVAIHAHLRLRFFVELLVTQFALLFFLDVPFDDIAGHQEFVRLRLQRQCEQETSQGQSA